MQSELKPCPFCGSDRLMVLPPTCDRNTPYSAADRAYPVVRCSDCYTDVPGKDFDASGKSAVEAWNRREGIPEDTASDDALGYVLRYGGMCRDCADMDGVCQSGQPCDTEQRRAVIKHTIAALAYGIKHGFIANPLTAALPDKQAGEVSCIACEGRPSAGNNPCAVCGRSALVDVPAVEPVTDSEAIIAWYGRLGTEWRRKDNRSPAHMTTPREYVPAPLSREGEDSAEVERLRNLLSHAEEYVIDGVTNAKAEAEMNAPYPARAPRYEAALAEVRQLYADIRAALAATRSGSATDQKGGSDA